MRTGKSVAKKPKVKPRGRTAYSDAKRREIVEYARSHSINAAHHVYDATAGAIRQWLKQFPASTVMTRPGAPQTTPAVLRRMAEIKETCEKLMEEYDDLMKYLKKPKTS